MVKRKLFGIRCLIVLAVGFLILECGVGYCKAESLNTLDISDGMMREYFDSYREMEANSDLENIIIVKNETRPEDYGAERVIEAPGNVYYLQYGTTQEYESAWEKLKLDDLDYVVSNIVFELAEDEQGGELEFDEGQTFMSWGIKAMGLNRAIQAVENKTNANKLLVAAIDTGVKTSVFNEYFPDRTLYGYCLEGCEDGMDDIVGHGTHVIGTIAEGTSNNADLLMVRVSSSGSFKLSSLLTSINYAVAQGADVLNISAGVIFNFDLENHRQSWEITKGVIDDAEAVGVIVVSTAGNTGDQGVNYPASYDTAISVGAVDDELERSGISNYNEYLDFVAPGIAINGLNYAYTGEEGQSIMVLNHGTSMAAPHITAAVANLKSFNKNLKLSEVMELLEAYAVDLGDEGRDDYYGYGFVNFSEADFCISGKSCDEYGVFIDLDSEDLPEEDDEDEEDVVVDNTDDSAISVVPVVKSSLAQSNSEIDENDDEDGAVVTVPLTANDKVEINTKTYTAGRKENTNDYTFWDRNIYLIVTILIIVGGFLIVGLYRKINDK